MTYQFVAALMQALGGRVRQVRIDPLVEKSYVATVEVEGSLGAESIDARSSDALNLAALVQAPILSPRRSFKRPRRDVQVIPLERRACVRRWRRRQ
jgi:bifunctional DNase/RNase